MAPVDESFLPTLSPATPEAMQAWASRISALACAGTAYALPTTLVHCLRCGRGIGRLGVWALIPGGCVEFNCRRGCKTYYVVRCVLQDDGTTTLRLRGPGRDGKVTEQDVLPASG